MLADLRSISTDLKLHVFIFLLEDYFKNARIRYFTVAELKEKIDTISNSLYNNQEFLEKSPLLVIKNNEINGKKKGYKIGLNHENETVKYLITVEFFLKNGLSIDAIDRLLKWKNEEK